MAKSPWELLVPLPGCGHYFRKALMDGTHLLKATARSSAYLLGSTSSSAIKLRWSFSGHLAGAAKAPLDLETSGHLAILRATLVSYSFFKEEEKKAALKHGQKPCQE